MEMAERNTQEFRIHPTTSGGSQVNQLTKKDIKNNEQCFRCGGKHSGQSCKFKSAKCYRCSKIIVETKMKQRKGQCTICTDLNQVARMKRSLFPVLT